jgi:hypothetical protein
MLSAALLVVLILVVLYFTFKSVPLKSEKYLGGDVNTVYQVDESDAEFGLGNVPTERSVSLMNFRDTDPKLSKYTQRERDTMGLDGADYYYENDTLYRSLVIPEQLEHDLYETHGTTEPGQRGSTDPEFQYFQHLYSDLPLGLTQSDLPIGPQMGGSVESAEQFSN